MVPFRRIVVLGFFITRPWRLGWVRLFAQAKEPGARPMCPGDPLGNHGQRPIALAVVFEPVLAHEDGMGAPTPFPTPRSRRSSALCRDRKSGRLFRTLPPESEGGAAECGSDRQGRPLAVYRRAP